MKSKLGRYSAICEFELNFMKKGKSVFENITMFYLIVIFVK